MPTIEDRRRAAKKRRLDQEHKNNYKIFELTADTMEVVRIWDTISEAARAYNLSRQAIHQAIHEGTVRNDHRWMFKHVYDVWLWAHKEGNKPVVHSEDRFQSR